MGKFRQANGLTVYALVCGYIQRATAHVDGKECRVDLWHEGACYHVRAHEFGDAGRGRLCWDSFDSLTTARGAWHRTVRAIFGAQLRAVAADGRYSVRQEFHGEAEPSYVARFSGEWVGKADTREGAALVAWGHKQRAQGADDATQ